MLDAVVRPTGAVYFARGIRMNVRPALFGESASLFLQTRRVWDPVRLVPLAALMVLLPVSGCDGPTATVQLNDSAPTPPIAAHLPTQSGEYTTHTPTCAPGSLGCTCDLNGWCEPFPGAAQPVACVNNYCVVDDCPRGSLACPCYGNGTCDPVDGVPMTCDEEVCTPTEVPDPGTLGGACGEIECGYFGGSPMECMSGICAIPSCPFGSLNCPCGAYGRCAEYRGTQMECVDGFCLLDPCAPGEPGCTCAPGATPCVGENICIDGLCRLPRVEAFVDDGRVRACDLVFEESGGQVLSTGWGAEVIGEHYHRSPRLAASFIARDDAPIESVVFWFEVSEPFPGEVATDGALAQARCFDRFGDEITTEVIRIEGRSTP